MAKKNLERNIEICFVIKNSNRFNISHTLIYRSSNYELSLDEITRASLRPDNLTLDNKIAYVKTNEDAFLNENEENILKINYCRLEH